VIADTPRYALIHSTNVASLPGYYPPWGRLGGMSFISILGIDISAFHCSLDEMYFYLSGQQALVEILHLLWEV